MFRFFLPKVTVKIRKGKGGKYYCSIPEAKLISAVPGYVTKKELKDRINLFFRPNFVDQTGE